MVTTTGICKVLLTSPAQKEGILTVFSDRCSFCVLVSALSNVTNNTLVFGWVTTGKMYIIVRLHYCKKL